MLTYKFSSSTEPSQRRSKLYDPKVGESDDTSTKATFNHVRHVRTPMGGMFLRIFFHIDAPNQTVQLLRISCSDLRECHLRHREPVQNHLICFITRVNQATIFRKIIKIGRNPASNSPRIRTKTRTLENEAWQ